MPSPQEASASSQLPLTGFKVIDLGHFIAGPLVGLICADQGAEVIKVNPPGGPRWCCDANSTLNRGKSEIEVDLSTADGRARVKQLCLGADLVIENCRPGVMVSKGLGAEELTKENPSLVYLSLPGFASDDEEHRDLPAYESIISAVTGTAMAMGINRLLSGFVPAYAGLPQASVLGAILGSIGAILALRRRLQTGRGDILEVPLAAAVLEGLCYNFLDIKGMPDRYACRRELVAAEMKEKNEPFDLTFQQVKDLQEPEFKTYICKDGRPFYVVTVGHSTHIRRSSIVLGIEEEIKNIYLEAGGGATVWENLGDKCPMGKMYVPEPYMTKITKLLEKAFLEKTAYEWQEIWFKENIPGCAVQTTAEYMKGEHLLQSGLMLEVDDSRLGAMLQPGPLVWFKDDMADATEAPLKKQKQDTAEMPLPTGTAWMSGLNVLDFSNVIAGPICGGMTAHFGADVITVQPLNITYDPLELVYYGICANQGKRSTLIDIAKEGGQQILKKLIAWADVIMWNGVERQLKALNLDFETIKTINPQAILCRPDFFGGPTGKGIYEGVIGYDDNIQANSGIMHRCGNTMEEAEEYAHVGTLDVPTGFSSCLSITLGLLEQQRTKKAVYCRASLAMTGQYFQLPYMYDHPGRVHNEVRGRNRGPHPLHHFYQCADEQWVCVAATPAFASTASREAATAKLVEGGIVATDISLLEGLMSFCEGRSSLDVKAAFNKLSIACTELKSITEVRAAYTSRQNATFAFVKHPEHPSGLAVTQVQMCASIRTREAKHVVCPPAVKFGTHTREVLMQLGYTTKEVDTFFESKVAADGNTQDGVYFPH